MSINYNSITFAKCIESDLLITVNKSYKVLNTYKYDKVKKYLILNNRQFLEYYPDSKFQIIEN